jgi:2-oxoglutarate ferredoxin oxidoreductase subunit delta
MTEQVVLDLALCKACGICIALCPEKVFDVDRQRYPVVARPEECTSCLLCELHCPDFAIEVKRRARKRPAGKPAAAAAPELTHADLLAAAAAAADASEACGHDGVEG